MKLFWRGFSFMFSNKYSDCVLTDYRSVCKMLGPVLKRHFKQQCIDFKMI